MTDGFEFPPASSPSNDPQRLVGQVISGRYRIDELIGEGGMGAVYRAEHVTMRKRLAVKVLRPEVHGVAEIVARFEREAIAGAHIEHPNVAAATDFGELEDGSRFLVLEFLEGHDLRSVMIEGPMPIVRALKIAKQIALALRAAHDLGIVHRDLKPENVMLLEKDGQRDFVKVLDFGIAKVPVGDLGTRSGASVAAITQLGMVYGTPEYMAPEQALGQEIDGRADLYALGGMVYEMVCGTRVFEAADRARLIELVTGKSPPALSTRRSDVPPPVDAFVAKLLSKRAAMRFENGAEVAREIDRLIPLVEASLERSPNPPAVTTGRLTDFGAPPRAAVPRATTLATAGLLAISVVVGGAVALRDPETVRSLEASGEDESAEPAAADAPTADRWAAPSPKARVPAQELEAAKLGGLTTLGPLATRFPNDPNVLKALMIAHSEEPTGLAAAMRVAKKLVRSAPDMASDKEVVTTVQTALGGAADAVAAAYEVIPALGPAGPDLLFSVATTDTTPKPVKEKALAALDSPEIKKNFSPALKIALELKAQQPCNRKALFERARDEGDARALNYLKPLQAKSGCGFLGRKDCFYCLGNRAELNEAMEAIEGRSGKPAGSAKP